MLRSPRKRRVALLLSFSISTALLCLFQEFIALHYDPRSHHRRHQGGFAAWSRHLIGLSKDSNSPRYLQTTAGGEEKEKDQDVHYSHTEFLPLTDWEQQSLDGLRKAAETMALARQQKNATTTLNKESIAKMVDDSCQPPQGIPKQCCIGTFAGMGRIIHNRRQHCAYSWQEQEQLLPHFVHQELQERTRTFPTAPSQLGCDICQLVDAMHDNNQTLAFWGDSVSHQTFQGLVCELYRRNYIVQESSIHFQNPSRKRRQKQQERQQKQSNMLDPLLTSSISNSNTGVFQHQTRQSPCKGINHCLHLVRTIQVSSPLWIQKNNYSNINNNTIRIHFFHQYRLPSEDIMQEEWVLNTADILVLNFGLHWGANYGQKRNDENETAVRNLDQSGPPKIEDIHKHPPTPLRFQQALAQLLTKISKHKNPPRLVFRETTAQHFDGEGGDYSFVKAQHKAYKKTQQQQQRSNHSSKSSSAVSTESSRLERQPLQCVPHHRDGPTSGWREQAVINAANGANYSVSVIGKREKTGSTIAQRLPLSSGQHHHQHLTILPFFDFTQQLHQLHPYDDRSDNKGGGGGGDCTHYCSSPYLYMPLWKSLRLALS